MQFTFASCIYVLGCGHSAGVRANRVVAQGARWHCVSCDSEETVTDVVTLDGRANIERRRTGEQR